MTFGNVAMNSVVVTVVHNAKVMVILMVILMSIFMKSEHVGVVQYINLRSPSTLRAIWEKF